MTSAPLTADAPGATAHSEAVHGEAEYGEPARDTADPDDFRHFMRMWATGIAVVTSRSAALSVGCTVTALTSVSLDPPLLLVSLNHRSRTLAVLKQQHRFGINILAAHQSSLAERFAMPCADRFGGVPHELIENVPILNGVLAAAVCRVERTIRIADHVLVLGLPGWCGGPPQTRDRPALIRFAGTSQPLPDSALSSRVAVRRNVKDA